MSASEKAWRSGVKPMKKDEMDEARQSLRSRKWARDCDEEEDEPDADAEDDDEDDDEAGDSFTSDCVSKRGCGCWSRTARTATCSTLPRKTSAECAAHSKCANRALSGGTRAGPLALALGLDGEDGAAEAEAGAADEDEDAADATLPFETTDDADTA